MNREKAIQDIMAVLPESIKGAFEPLVQGLTDAWLVTYIVTFYPKITSGQIVLRYCVTKSQAEYAVRKRNRDNKQKNGIEGCVAL